MLRGELEEENGHGFEHVSPYTAWNSQRINV